MDEGWGALMAYMCPRGRLESILDHAAWHPRAKNYMAKINNLLITHDHSRDFFNDAEVINRSLHLKNPVLMDLAFKFGATEELIYSVLEENKKRLTENNITAANNPFVKMNLNKQEFAKAYLNSRRSAAEAANLTTATAEPRKVRSL